MGNPNDRRPFQGVFFDLDGTLADTAPDLVAAVNLMRTKRMLEPKSYLELRPLASAGARGLIGGAFGIDPSHPDFVPLRDEFFNNYEQALHVHSRLFDGVDQLLDHLDLVNMPWGIITNKSTRFTTPLTQMMGLSQRAISTVSGDTTEFSKPHPQPILHAARLANIAVDRALYVGDDIRDIIAGKAAGMKTVAAMYGYCGCAEPPQEWGADYLIENSLDLLKILFPTL